MYVTDQLLGSCCPLLKVCGCESQHVVCMTTHSSKAAASTRMSLPALPLAARSARSTPVAGCAAAQKISSQLSYSRRCRKSCLCVCSAAALCTP
jgi:hypothetical protein